MTLRLHYPTSHSEARRWIATVILSRFGNPFELICEERSDWFLECSDAVGENRVPSTSVGITLADSFFSQGDDFWLSPTSLPKLPLQNFCTEGCGCHPVLTDRKVPVIFGTSECSVEPGNHARVGLDIFGSAFFMLSRYEEVVLDDRDEHGRFPATASLAYRAGFLDRPIVDEYCEILWAVAKKLWPHLERIQRQFRVLPSHDVDQPCTYAFRGGWDVLRESAGALFKRHTPLTALRGPCQWIVGHYRLPIRDPLNTFSWLMDVSERNSLVSAFYFMCGRTCERLDAHYEIESRAMRRLLRTIHARGHEVGLHPSYNTFRQPDQVCAEATRLRTLCAEESIEQSEWGGRMHYLRWETPITLSGWDQTQMDYDSTLGFADHVGFRCGTCIEYPAFDPIACRPLRIRIRPLIAMETTVLSRRYMGHSSAESAYGVFKQLKDACRMFRGDFTILWHNSELQSREQQDLYRSVIEA